MDKVKRIITGVVLIFIILFIMPLLDNGKADLGKGFVYFEEPSHIYYFRKGDTTHIEIPPYVISYKNSPRYLLIKHHPRKYDDVMFSRYNYPNGRDTIYYWLIDKDAKMVYGPVLFSEMESYLETIHQKQIMIAIDNNGILERGPSCSQ